MEPDYSWVSQARLLALIGAAVLLGAVIGFNREAENKPAGLRTHMLVAGAAALIAVIGRTVFFDAGGTAGDPNRPLQAVIMGVGFLGAGTILRRPEDFRVEGLTTAASLFFTAAIGLAAGFDLVPLAVGAAAIVTAVLALLPMLERRLIDQDDADHRGGPHDQTGRQNSGRRGKRS